MAARKPAVKAGRLPTREEFNAWVETQQSPTFIPPEQLTVEDVQEWREAAETLSRVKSKEMLLRLKIFKHYFVAPEEGTNNAETLEGFIVKGGYKITRDVDAAGLAVVKALTVGQVREHLTKLGFDVSQRPDDCLVTEALQLHIDKLVKWEPSLSIRDYRTLTNEQRAIFDTCMTIKAGSPTVEIIPPKAEA